MIQGHCVSRLRQTCSASLAVLLLLALTQFCLAGPAAAFEKSAWLGSGSAKEEPLQVGVGIKVDQITEVNQKAGQFGAVVTTRLLWFDPKLSFEPVANERSIRILSVQQFIDQAKSLGATVPYFAYQYQRGPKWINESLVTLRADGTAEFFEQVTLTFLVPGLDFTKFPFDTQTFSVGLTSVSPVDTVLFYPIVEGSGLGEKLGEEAWILKGAEIRSGVISGLSGLDSSLTVLEFTGGRHVQYYFLRLFIPMGLLVFLSWCTFFLEDYRKRIEITGANFLVFVAFNFAISDSLPQLGYLTFVDFLLQLVFLVTGAVIVLNVALRRIQVSGREDVSRRIDNYVVKWIFPFGYIGVVVIAVRQFLMT